MAKNKNSIASMMRDSERKKIYSFCILQGGKRFTPTTRNIDVNSDIPTDT